MSNAKQMARDALKLAVLQSSYDMLMTDDELRKCEAAIAALDAELAQVAEPVAYLHMPGVDGEEYSDCFEVNIVGKEAEKLQEALVKHSDIDGLTIPLYTAPPEPVNAELLAACKAAFAVVGAMQPSKPLIDLAYQLAEAIKKAGATT